GNEICWYCGDASAGDQPVFLGGARLVLLGQAVSEPRCDRAECKAISANAWGADWHAKEREIQMSADFKLLEAARVEAEAGAFKIGDVWRLKSGSCPMTIEEIERALTGEADMKAAVSFATKRGLTYEQALQLQIRLPRLVTCTWHDPSHGERFPRRQF